MQGMGHSFLIFDFGGNEDAAQLARHRIDGWKQGFRLDKKLQVKFVRDEPDAKADAAAAPAKAAKSGAKGKAKSGANSKSGDESASEANSVEGDPAQIRLIVRLDFSDHEKLTHQRWVERIPTEEPFKAANPKIVRAGESEFKATSDLFDSLD
jgi:flagellar hook protein FlgE